MTTVIATQLDSGLGLLSPPSPASDGVLNRVASGWAKPGATSGAATLDDPWESGFDILVGGTGLTNGSWGQLTGGTVTTISVLSPSGQIMATFAKALPAGLALDAGLLAAAYRSPERARGPPGPPGQRLHAPLHARPGRGRRHLRRRGRPRQPDRDRRRRRAA
jgi:hypothetical protein